MGLEAIIADDLTGAMDTGMQLLSRGVKVNVLPVIENIESINSMYQDTDLIVVNSETRNISAEKAYGCLQKITQFLVDKDITIKYKKIDSTIRGNIGIEIKALLQNGSFDMVLLAPALPHNGRTIVDGYHYLNGKLLTESDIAKDPFSPVNDAFIPSLIKTQTNIKTSVVSLETIRKGKKALADRLVTEHNNGGRIIVADAKTEHDLCILSQVIKETALKILPCGSAGLFLSMSKCDEQYDSEKMSKNIQYSSNYNKDNKNHICSNKPILAVSGSPAEASKEQIKVASHNDNIEVIYVDITQDSDLEKEENFIVDRATSLLSKGINVIIDVAGESKEVILNKYKDNIALLKKQSSRIRAVLASAVYGVLTKVEIEGIMIIGGDTSVSLCDVLGIKEIRIQSEAEPFIPCGLIYGGLIDKKRIITKAGGFGTEESILNCIKYLKGDINYGK